MSKYGIDYVRIRLELDRRVLSDYPIRTPEDAVMFLSEQMKDLDREVLAVVDLALDGRPVNMTMASVGTLKAAIAEPRELYKAAILCNADSILLAHNHPSGALEASSHDVDITNRMIECGRILGIPLVDHVIIAGYTGMYRSLREDCLCDFEQVNLSMAAEERSRYMAR